MHLFFLNARFFNNLFLKSFARDVSFLHKLLLGAPVFVDSYQVLTDAAWKKTYTKSHVSLNFYQSIACVCFSCLGLIINENYFLRLHEAVDALLF